MKQPTIEEVAGGSVSRETLTRLETFAALVARWSQTVNLVSRRDIPEIWHRHVIDSAQLVPLLPPGVALIRDLGSGGGFPGLVIAILTGIPTELIESDRRKAAFLREAARETGVPVTVHTERIEALTLPHAPVITARALAPVAALLDLAAPQLGPDGVCLFLKGAHADLELTQARERWQMRVERHSSRTDPSASVLKISEIRPVPHSKP